MTVTVIIIIAVIIVLAVLVLLLLGMRALSLGSHEDDYEDDYYDEYDEPDLDRHEDEEPRGRSRRARQSGGKAERRPRKRRGVDWEDDPDELSDNDFWSSLSEEDPAQRQPSPHVGAPEHDEPQYEDEHSDRTAPPGVPSPLSAPESGMAALADLGRGSDPQQSHVPEPSGESDHHAPAPFEQQALPPRPEPSALPPTQEGPPGLPAAHPTTDTSYQDDPLGRPSWAPGDPLGSPAEHTRAPLGDDPLGGVGTPPQNEPFGAPGGSYGITGDPLEGPYSPPQGPSVGDPLPGLRSSYESGTHSRPTEPYQEAFPSPSDPLPGLRSPYESGTHSRPTEPYQEAFPSPSDPLDPGFRPSPQVGGSDTSSPIWSSMDTGAHQRPDPSVLRGPAPEDSITDPGAGYGAPGPHEYPASPAPGPYGQGAPAGDPLSGAHPSMSHFDQGFDGGYTPRSPYDSGTHTRPTYDTDPYGLTNPTPNPGPPPQNPPSPYDSGAHTRPTYDTDPYSRPEPSFDGGYTPRSPYDSGTHTRPTYDTDPYGLTNPTPNPGPPPQNPPSPYDSGTHTRPTYDTDPYSRPEPSFDGGYTPRSPYDSGTHTRPTYDTDPYGLTNPTPNPGPPPQNPPFPYDGGMHGGPAQPGPAYPGGVPLPGDVHGHPPMPPSGGYSVDQLRGEPRGHGEQPAGTHHTPSGGYSDVLGGGYPTHQPEYGDPLPPEGWGQRDRQAHDQRPYDPRDYPQEPYEGGYDNGRFH